MVRSQPGWLIAGVLVLATPDGVAAEPAGVLPAQAQTGRVDRLPIAGLDRIQQADGSVVYLSTDRRFAFRGEMTDLWTGEDVGVVLPSGRINLERNGVSPAAYGFNVGRVRGDAATLFVAPECEPCRELIRRALAPDGLAKRRYRVVLLDASPGGERANRIVWCAADRAEALRAVYVDGTTPRSAAKRGASCDQTGLYLAKEVAQAFGVGQLPLAVDVNGRAHVGVPETLESLFIRSDGP